ncbi:DUF397 domain-containing protein [Streptomyces sp. PSKA54]|uniref:DUF397 domain-containing protein n=1 Tax=Streptomyces himalayensis subsp. aureolus TaxID=2758039 RepID=A0A7W2HEU4_9ACTN|nr:DUF397 domain-containing protein [Streptomyces himalayensis]MBA4861298.1 DUF397 domain-containing protein [Streptomyces himalayensis subsp. aureolus]
MTSLNWQKSTHSEEGSSCVYIAAAPDGTIRLRESDEPDVILLATRAQLGTLIAAIKAGTTH